jgi:hypothetical protein
MWQVPKTPKMGLLSPMRIDKAFNPVIDGIVAQYL